MGAILISNGLLLTMCEESEPTPREGWVGVVDGTIAMVGYDGEEAAQFLREHPSAAVIDAKGGVVMPGLVNTHTHISMTLLRNYADDMELMEWLTKYIWRFEAKMSREDIASGARLGIAELLLGGCTSFVDMYWCESSIAQVVRQMGIRAQLGESLLDGREQLFVEEMDRLLAEVQGCSRLSCCVAPHAPYTCSPETLGIARDYAEQHDLPITIHLSETEGEIETIRERYGCSPLDYIEQAGLLTPRTILAHVVHITTEQIARLAESGASVAHNAQSNLKLASGIAPIAKMHEAGVRCTIATDGASSNNDLDMWEELRTATLLQRVKEMNPTALPAYEVLRMATLYGARAMGYDNLGLIEEGAIADLIVVDMGALYLRPRHNVVSALVYSAKASDVRYVVVDGVVVVDDRELVGVDLEALCRDVEQRCERIEKEIE